jgi:hypothetical protein
MFAILANEEVRSRLTEIFFGVSVVIVAITLVITHVRHAAKFRQAEDDYEECLEELEDDPTNPRLRRNALELGRIYFAMRRRRRRASSSREDDEETILDDIDAACASGRRRDRKRKRER